VAGLACPLAHPLAPSIKFKEFELTGCWLWAGGQPANKQRQQLFPLFIQFTYFFTINSIYLYLVAF